MRIGFALLLMASTVTAEPAKIGDTVAKLSLTDIRSLPRSLDELAPKKPLVLAFTNTSCPVAQRYLPVLNAMAKDYPGVQFAIVNPAEEDTLLDTATHALKHDVQFPVLKDFEAAAAQTLGVKRTPEVVLLDATRKLVYRGRIDDQYRLRGVRKDATSPDLKNAIDAILAGKPVEKAETDVDGCPITFPQPREAKKVNYAEHVAPILKTHCWDCHKTGGSAPFSLTSHHQASNRAASIVEVITDQRMPPWFASHEFGPFANRRGLTDDEKTILKDWARSGAVAGELSKAPSAPKAEENPWKIGEPDTIIKTVTIDLPAKGDIPYQYVTLPHIFTQDTWVDGVQILPDNPRVLHHCNMAWGSVFEGFNESNFITGQVPGGEAMTCEPGTAYLIPRGSILGLQIHFVATGKPEKCKISVGLHYPREKVQRRLRNLQLNSTRFAIPPGAMSHKVTTSRTLTTDVTGIALFSHMHLRGKDMTFIAHTPDGKSETLLMIPNYNFSWQIPYRWETGKKTFPQGTKLECMAHFDNSTFNPYNPDPKATVKFGLQTHQEMHVGFFFYTENGEPLNLTINPKTGGVVK